MAVMDRDPACRSYLDALLYFKGALRAHGPPVCALMAGRNFLAGLLPRARTSLLLQVSKPSRLTV
jgi:serine acetyltransferase